MLVLVVRPIFFRKFMSDVEIIFSSYCLKKMVDYFIFKQSLYENFWWPFYTLQDVLTSPFSSYNFNSWISSDFNLCWTKRCCMDSLPCSVALYLLKYSGSYVCVLYLVQGVRSVCIGTPSEIGLDGFQPWFHDSGASVLSEI